MTNMRPFVPRYALADALMFVSTVELGSFTAAAEAHAITSSGVSKAVSRLEADLGVRLLARSTRSLRLTDEGALFFERSREALALMNEGAALATETSQTLKGVLRVGIPPTLGARVGVPALRRFLPLHPELTVQYVSMVRLAAFYELRVDCAIVVGEVDDATLAGRRLGVGALSTVASPAYLASFGTPETPDALSRHACITVVEPSGHEAPWRFRSAGNADPIELAVRGRVRTDVLEQVIAAAAAGLGIAQAPASMTAHEVEEGRLVRLFPECEVDGPAAWIVYPAQGAIPRRVRALVEFLANLPPGTVVPGVRLHVNRASRRS